MTEPSESELPVLDTTVDPDGVISLVPSSIPPPARHALLDAVRVGDSYGLPPSLLAALQRFAET